MQERYRHLQSSLQAAEEAARAAAEQAPPAAVWSRIRQRAADLDRNWDEQLRQARAVDGVALRRRVEQARRDENHHDRLLKAALQETERRRCLPNDQRQAEHAARAEHQQRLRDDLRQILDAANQQEAEPGQPTAGCQDDRWGHPAAIAATERATCTKVSCVHGKLGVAALPGRFL